ncbi:actin-like ATPase domain-containing protein [Ramaria rubella]|nr:actin-like ATPase domain-containing protein [Ramaria rubella]
MLCMRSFVFLFLGLFVATDYVLASILAVDYGTDWIKASLMKPGVPFDVLLNRDSKRKIQASVGWKGSDRLFGSDAFNIATRFPKDSFSSLKHLQGKTFDTDAVAFYASISTNEIFETARKTVGLRKADDSEWSVEELIAMQFAYIKELAESVADNKVLDVVITVPPFFSQFERQAVLDVAEVSGLRPISLINDGTAVAVNYALTRTFQNPETHVIYDAGAGSIRASVVAFSTGPTPDIQSKSKSKGNTTSIEVKSIGYARGTGGNELDRRLREVLIEDFNAKHKKDIRGDLRGLTKLWKEAGRVKAVLSANADASTTVESVAFDVDYRSKVSRATFEAQLIDLRPTFTQPIVDALEAAGLTLEDITSVILTGGSSRTPIIQQAVRDLVGDAKIAQNVNADEAAVLGAAFYGASISSQFKTKDIKVQDITPYDIQVSYVAESKPTSVRPRTITTLLFPTGSKYGSKKTLTLKRKEDFFLRLSYKSPQAGVFPSDISEAQILGVSEALGNLTERGAIEPVVKVTVVLSESGFAVVDGAIAFGEIKDDSITGKLKGLFGVLASSEDSSTESSTADSSDAAVSSPSASVVEKQKQQMKDKDPSTISLKVDVAPLSIHPLTLTEKRKSRDKLIAVDQAELAKRRREDARNALETYLYRVRDLLDSDSSTPFIIYSKEDERNQLSELLQDTFHWISESGESADTLDLWGKRDALERIEKPIQQRYKESETIVPALADLEQALIAGNTFLESARQNFTIEAANEVPHKYTLEELEAVEARLTETTTWMREGAEKQKKLALHDDPVLLTAEVKARGVTLQNHVMRLLRRKVPKPKKVTTEAATENTSEEARPTTERVEEESPRDHDEL